MKPPKKKTKYRLIAPCVVYEKNGQLIVEIYGELKLSK